MMTNSIVKILIGIWLIISGMVGTLEHPVNLIIVGAFLAICCFLSSKTWQIITTGILGLWLFFSGMINVLGRAVSLVSSVNFVTMGLLVFILGIWSYIIESKMGKVKTHTV
jgi:hypothetical protein